MPSIANSAFATSVGCVACGGNCVVATMIPFRAPLTVRSSFQLRMALLNTAINSVIASPPRCSVIASVTQPRM